MGTDAAINNIIGTLFAAGADGDEYTEEDFKLKWDSGEIEVGNVRELREFKGKLSSLKK